MANDTDLADDVIPGSLKRSKSYYSDYGKKTYKEIKDLAADNPPDQKARQMKKLIEASAEAEGGGHVSHTRAFKKALARISRLSAANDYDAALKEVESLLKTWPGNPQAHVLRASFIQLQDDPGGSLDDVKETLQEAVELDQTSPAAAIELAHFLDAIEDDPKAAVNVYAEAIDRSRHLLIEALIGQAKAFLQLEKKAEALKCLVELLQLTGTASSGKRSKSASSANGLLPKLVGREAHRQIENLV